MSKVPFFFTIDLEDFSQDYRRRVTGNEEYVVRTEAMWSAYRKVSTFCESHLGGRRITFFTTGVLAHHFPEFVRAIAADGHEIGCHYYFHDSVGSEDTALLGKRLDEALNALTTAAQQTILGFRDPYLSITHDRVANYREIAKRFAYDSSLSIDRPFDDKDVEWNDITLDGKMRLFPIAMAARFGGKLKVRSGGTFVKLFPVEWTINAMHMGRANGFVPSLYLHPYEFVDDRSFWVKWGALEGISLPRRALAWSRQIQWHVVGNHKVPDKLDRILEEFEHIGPMKMLLAGSA